MPAGTFKSTNRFSTNLARNTGRSGISALGGLIGGGNVGSKVGSGIARSSSAGSRAGSGTQSYYTPKKTYTPTARPRTQSYSNTPSSGSYGGSVGSSNYSGGASSPSYSPPQQNFAAMAAPAAVMEPPPPPPPVMEDVTIPDPLADPVFQRQKAELARAAADFNAAQGLARSQYDTSVNNNFRQMGWRGEGWDPRARGTAYGNAWEGNEGDFAGRGLYNSGLRVQAEGDINSDFNDRRSGILTAQKDWRDTQDLSKRNFEGQQRATEQSALSDAIAAIVAKYGVNNNQVTPGRQNVIQREKV